ncbi:hypothetical protein [Fodinibius salsisoli]|uniref:Metallo-beta-lactamase domain-containing protein n=1 Tax=Fodinibius salsisoli TaxID=2820877 RepID=A0ABT3PHL0_9BACT|nr:hypothetical protein [Fodinibius salsisoli]MCW9705409.1 hypothetical protein [Fodinibius salsisoli]
MEHYVCTTCGSQFEQSNQVPESCPICEDERQYVPASGQQWTTLEKLQGSYRNTFQKKEDGLYGIGTTPTVGIGQRALLIQTAAGNVLWDCLTFLDEATVDIIKALGGLEAIAISHPHYYTTMVEWSKAFGDIPIYLHAADQEWVMRPDKRIHFWEGDTYPLLDDLTLIRVGGHFEGGTVLHWPSGADSKGVLLSGDILQVVADRKHLSFMYSYPNQIPLSALKVQQIADRLDGYSYDCIYGAFWNRNILQDAESAVERSVQRYIAALE